MTPNQRKNAEEFCCRAKLAASATLAPAPIADLMMAALLQIEDDEGLMERAIEALVVGGDYQADAWNDAKKLCADHGWHRVDAEKIQVAIDALRTRLGEESDDERE